MCPGLFHIVGVPIRSYGVMLALSFIVGLAYVHRIGTRDNKRVQDYIFLAYLLIIAGVVGARLFYIGLHLEEFSGNWGAAVNPFDSDAFGIAGLNLYGGVILAIITAWVYLRLTSMPVFDTMDYFAPTLGLGLFLTRIGCFLNGCCFGTPTDLPWGVTFPPDSMPYFVYFDQALHPAQLYSSLYGLLLFIFLHVLLKRRRFEGQVLAVLLMCEAVFRFAIEYVRFYDDAMQFTVGSVTITWNQVFSVMLFALGVFVYRRQQDGETSVGPSIPAT